LIGPDVESTTLGVAATKVGVSPADDIGNVSTIWSAMLDSSVEVRLSSNASVTGILDNSRLDFESIHAALSDASTLLDWQSMHAASLFTTISKSITKFTDTCQTHVMGCFKVNTFTYYVILIKQ